MARTSLTALEMQTLQLMATELEAISKSYTANEDTIQDFLYSQFKLKTDEPESLAVTRKHLSLVISKLENVQTTMDLFVDHFIHGK